MNRIFLRFTVLVMLSISAATITIYFATNYFFGDPFEDIARKQAAAQIFLLEQYIDHAPADEWLTRLNKVREVSGPRFELIPLAQAQAAVGQRRQTALLRGDVVLDIAGKAFFRRVDIDGQRYVGSESEVLHAQDLPIDIGLVVKMEVLRYVIVALCLLIPIAFWSRSHWQDLQALSKAADDLGEGKLDTRLQIAPRAGIYPLAQRMNQMAERIQNLLDSHRSLVHAISHELRTPTARLAFGVELLREEAQAPLPEARLRAMETDIEELAALVDELLDLARLDQEPSLRTSEFDLSNLLHESARQLAHAFTEKALSLNLGDASGPCMGERRLLLRAIDNILLNAAKYGKHQVIVTARIFPGDSFEVVVEDDGPGIAEIERERVFEPFYRVDRSRDENTGGFGLGLAIAQKIVTLHGGSISISTSALGGAKFTVTIPLARARTT